MNLMFKWQNFPLEHQLHILELTCNVLFIIDILDYFPKISDHSPKIFQNISESQTNVPEHFPKIAEDFRVRPEDVSIIHQRI